MLESYEGKLSRPVLRGEGGRKVLDLPGPKRKIMKELSVGKIRRSLKRFEDFASDLARSDMNTFNDRLRMLMDYCKSDPVLSMIHVQLISMPGVDFDSWHKKVLSTVRWYGWEW